MPSLSLSTPIAAPAQQVFEAVAHIDNFSAIIPDIVRVELLTAQRSGVGTRFRETRVMKGREATVELAVTEYQAPEHVRLVSESGGTTWDTRFSVSTEGAGCRLTTHMDARPNTLVARLITPMLMGMLRKAIEQDLQTVKAHCEAQAQ